MHGIINVVFQKIEMREIQLGSEGAINPHTGLAPRAKLQGLPDKEKEKVLVFYLSTSLLF
jgi:hypothetical protein